MREVRGSCKWLGKSKKERETEISIRVPAGERGSRHDFKRWIGGNSDNFTLRTSPQSSQASNLTAHSNAVGYSSCRWARRNPISSHHVTGRTTAGHCLENESLSKILGTPEIKLDLSWKLLPWRLMFTIPKVLFRLRGRKLISGLMSCQSCLLQCQLVHQDMFAWTTVPQYIELTSCFTIGLQTLSMLGDTHLVRHNSSKTYDCGGYGPKRGNTWLLFH